MKTTISAALAIGAFAFTGVSCTNTGPTGTSTIGQSSDMNSTTAVLGQVFGGQNAGGSTYNPGSYESAGYDQGNMDYVDVTPVQPSDQPAPSNSSSAPNPRAENTPPTPPPAKRSNGGLVYEVKKGDTLYAISRSHKVSISAIQAANNLSGSTIHPGDLLTIR